MDVDPMVRGCEIVYLPWRQHLFSMCLNSVLNVKAVVAAFNQEKALVGAFSVITNLRLDIFKALEAREDAIYITLII